MRTSRTARFSTRLTSGPVTVGRSRFGRGAMKMRAAPMPPSSMSRLRTTSARCSASFLLKAATEVVSVYA